MNSDKYFRFIERAEAKVVQKKIYAIEREIVRHSQHGYNQQHGAEWFDEMADMCTERNDLKKMLKKLTS